MYDFRTFNFEAGSHETREQGMCIMEAVAYVAGETHTDHPECACPVISAFVRSWNDALQFDEDRQRLLGGFVFRLVGTKATEDIEEERRIMSARWFVTVFTPTMLDLVPSLRKHAKALRGLKTTYVHENKVLEALTAARKAAKKAVSHASWMASGNAALANTLRAAWDTAGHVSEDVLTVTGWMAKWNTGWDAARVATVDALGNAAWDAARDAAREAVMCSAEDAAWNAAWEAAEDALGHAAWDAAWDVASDATTGTLEDGAWDDVGYYALIDASWDAAKSAFGDAALAAALTAAGVASKDAKREAVEEVAWEAAWHALYPTVFKLERSAQRLVDRMIRLTEPRERKICIVKTQSGSLVS